MIQTREMKLHSVRSSNKNHHSPLSAIAKIGKLLFADCHLHKRFILESV